MLNKRWGKQCYELVVKGGFIKKIKCGVAPEGGKDNDLEDRCKHSGQKKLWHRNDKVEEYIPGALDKFIS